MSPSRQTSFLNVYQTPTFKNCAVEQGINEEEQRAISMLVRYSGTEGKVVAKGIGNLVYSLQWRDGLDIQYLVVGGLDAYLLALTDGDDPEPPRWRKLLTRLLDRVWIGALVELGKRGIDAIDNLLFLPKSVPNQVDAKESLIYSSPFGLSSSKFLNWVQPFSKLRANRIVQYYPNETDVVEFSFGLEKPGFYFEFDRSELYLLNSACFYTEGNNVHEIGAAINNKLFNGCLNEFNYIVNREQSLVAGFGYSIEDFFRLDEMYSYHLIGLSASYEHRCFSMVDTVLLRKRRSFVLTMPAEVKGNVASCKSSHQWSRFMNSIIMDPRRSATGLNSEDYDVYANSQDIEGNCSTLSNRSVVKIDSDFELSDVLLGQRYANTI